MKKVSLVILNWNRKKIALECLESVASLKLKNIKLQILVVDNASTDGSQKSLRKKLKEIENKRKNISGKLIKNNQNLGFAGGNNVGILYALDSGADYLLVINNDTIVDKNIVSELIKSARKNPDVGVISPKIYFAKGFEFHKDRYEKSELGKVIWYAGGDVDWQNVHGTNHGVDEVDKGQYDEVRETDFATGTCMFLRREALEDAGIFDEKYFMYLEDVDLSLRIRNRGWSVLYSPKTIIWHKVAQSSGIGGDLNDYFITRNRLLFGVRYAPMRSKIALIRGSIKLLFKGRVWQKIAVRDFYFGRFGKGSWE